MLAQLQAMRGDLPASIDAYQRGIDGLPPNARLLADFAEVLAISQQRRSRGGRWPCWNARSRSMPTMPRPTACWERPCSGGPAARGDPHLEKVLASMPADSDQARQIAALVESLKHPGAPVAASPGPASDTAADSAAVRVDGEVTLGGQAALPGDTLFIVVRAANGPRMPFAVSRIGSPSFPLRFSLGPENLMTPQRPIPADTAIVIEARLSASGQAMRQSGDRFGVTEPFVADGRPRSVRIDQTAP
ncbi:MAG: hypothetical protein R3E83_04075 [Burkholderiaceae bacterium]